MAKRISLAHSQTGSALIQLPGDFAPGTLAIGVVTVVQHPVTYRIGATAVNGVDWFSAPLPGQGNVVDWQLLHPGTLDYSDPTDRCNYDTEKAIPSDAHEWMAINKLVDDAAIAAEAATEGVDAAQIKGRMWKNQPGFACVFKDSKTGYDFEDHDYWLLSAEEDDTHDTYEKFQKNTQTDTRQGGAYNGTDTLHIADRRADLRVHLSHVKQMDIKSHTGGFVNDRPFFTDAKLCAVPWGKRLNVKIMDMSHGSRSTNETAVTRYKTLKDANAEVSATCVTSVKEPIAVELKVLLVDPEDQFKEY